MSDRANVPPTYDTGSALALCWPLTACFRNHDDGTECSDPCDTKSESNITEYFTDTVATMRVAKDVVDANIFGQQWGTSISGAPRDTAFCKCLHKFSDSFAHNCEYLIDF